MSDVGPGLKDYFFDLGCGNHALGLKVQIA